MNQTLPQVVTTAHEVLGFATCPLCHTADATLSTSAVAEGADWQCARCGQGWDATRLAAAAAYAAWVAVHDTRL